MPDPIQDYAAQMERAAEGARLLEDLAAAEAAVEVARSALWHYSDRYGFRTTAALTGLSLRTVARWRIEMPPCRTLRDAEARR